MKAKITKRSKKDGTLATIPLQQLLENEFAFPLGTFNCGEEVTAIVDGIPTIFIMARPDEDGRPTVMTTRALPRHIRLPRVGRPVYAEITEIR